MRQSDDLYSVSFSSSLGLHSSARRDDSRLDVLPPHRRPPRQDGKSGPITRGMGQTCIWAVLPYTVAIQATGLV